MKKSDEIVSVNGESVMISHPEKVMYPATGTTKRDVVEYYLTIAPLMLPHLRDHPVSLKRFPHGITGPVFFTKRCPANRPRFVTTTDVPHTSRVAAINACVVNSKPTLAWVANLAALEIHAHLFRASSPDRPRRIVFDLDPGDPATLIDCCRVALSLRTLLSNVGLTAFVKVSGSKGLHVFVPLNTPVTFEQSSAFARDISRTMERSLPNAVTSVMTKRKRVGKVLIDWSQNARHKTTVAVYSLRGREYPTVSLPVTWGELRDAVKQNSTAGLVCQIPDALKRTTALGDIFAKVLTVRQHLPKEKSGNPPVRQRQLVGRRMAL